MNVKDCVQSTKMSVTNSIGTVGVTVFNYHDYNHLADALIQSDVVTEVENISLIL